MADEENHANEPPPPPTESDVCFGDQDHPGTQHFVQVVEQIATFPCWVEEVYSPKVYHAINKELKHRRFFFHSKKQGKWVVAKHREKNREFEKAFEMQREKVLSKETDKALESPRVSDVEDVVDLEKGEPNIIQDFVEQTSTAATEEAECANEEETDKALESRVSIASRTAATASTEGTDPATVNLILSILGIVSIILYLMSGLSTKFLGVFWTWVAFGILHLLAMCDEKYGSANSYCGCATIYILVIVLLNVVHVIMVLTANEDLDYFEWMRSFFS